MTKEELLKLLKENLTITVNVGRRVEVNLYFDEVLICSDSDLDLDCLDD